MATLKLIFGLGLFIAVGIAGFKVIPPFFSNYEFEDAIKTEALQSTYTTRSEDDVRQAVIKRAKDFDISLTEKEVRVTRTGSSGNGSLSISVDYSIPVEMPGYSTTLDFHPSTSNKGVF
jgi:hypothetical protein